MQRLWKWSVRLFSLALIVGVVGIAGVIYLFWHYGRDLPDHHELARYEPPIITRVYAGDGRLIGEFADEKRVFVPVEAIPERVKQAFIATEDKTFYQHPGIDVRGLLRAVVVNLRNFGSGRRPVGASTITQQVAKNFLLTNAVSIERKIKEIVLAFRLERAFSKDHILELYLNEIYLGLRSYGIAAAAQIYFDKALDELSIAEAAYLAGLPKGPNNYHPFRKPDAAVARRNYVVQRMLEENFITADEATAAMTSPLNVKERAPEPPVGQHFVEEVRRQLIDRYGEDTAIGGGLVVRTTLSPRLQNIADRVLREGLIEYDRRHGWRGPITKMELASDWSLRLEDVERPVGLDPWELAVVLEMDDRGAGVGLTEGRRGYIPLAEMEWARPWQEEQTVGPEVKAPTDVLAVGEVIAVEALGEQATASQHGKPNTGKALYGLRQLPDVEGAIVAMDPHTGRVLAMSGGYSFSESQFNRATQAQRQSGSAFKPFVYLAALDQGYTPSTIVLDAPVVIRTRELGQYKPGNYSGTFYGPSPLRIGIEKSRNLMTIRLAQSIGVGTVARYGERFGIAKNMPRELGVALGAQETTVLQLTTAYAMLVNGGKRVTPTLIDRVQSRTGDTVFKHDVRSCDACRGMAWFDQPVPQVPDTRPQIGNPLSIYQIVSMLEGVVQRGTGARVAAVGKPIAGKTGTTNDWFDAWFVGFTPDLVVGVWVGFDTPRTLGTHETGSKAAAPIFTDFMTAALEDAPSIPFRIPRGISLVRVNAATGQPAQPGDEKVIVEAFRPGSEPEANSRPGTPQAPSGGDRRTFTGTGGQY